MDGTELEEIVRAGGRSDGDDGATLRPRRRSAVSFRDAAALADLCSQDTVDSTANTRLPPPILVAETDRSDFARASSSGISPPHDGGYELSELMRRRSRRRLQHASMSPRSPHASEVEDRPPSPNPSDPPTPAREADDYGFPPVEPPPDTDPALNPHIDAVKRANRRARRARRREAGGGHARSIVSGGASITTSRRGRGKVATALNTADKVLRKVTGRKRRTKASRRGSDSSSSSSSFDSASSSSSSSRGRTTMRGRVSTTSAGSHEGRRGSRSRSPKRALSTSTSSSTYSSSSSSSSSSASTWWRFWRDSSSASSDSKGTKETGWVPPLAPEFTLMTPSMLSNYTQVFSGSGARTPTNLVDPLLAQTAPFLGARDRQAHSTLPVFDLFTSPDVDSALQRLLAFWRERNQDDAAAGDLGVVDAQRPADRPRRRLHVEQTDEVESFDPASRLPEVDLAEGNEGDVVDDRPQKPQARRVKTDVSHTTRTRLPKIRRQPLSPSHRVAFTRQGTVADRPHPHPTQFATPSFFASQKTRNHLGPLPASAPPEGATPIEGSGPAWWLDILSPTAADMHRLRKVFPLHPLTIEDILHQDTREKLEVFDALGYYLVSFRALDEGYFRYTDGDKTRDAPDRTRSDADADSVGALKERLRQEKADARDDGSKASAASVKSARTVRSGKQRLQEHETARPSKKAKVEIVEPLGFRGGVEGAGAGGVNVYLVVFGDGVISFHFQDMQRHIDRVRERIQLVGSHVEVSPHWIAYGLMNSIVDAFFPVLSFVESESDELAAYLADPVGGDGRTEEATPSDAIRRFSMKRLRSMLPRLPSLKLGSIPFLELVSHPFKTQPKNAPSTTFEPRKGLLIDATDPLFDRGDVLRRITTNRKLVVAMTRLLAQKSQVVQNLRKRMREVHERPNSQRDIGVYLSDLHDHIAAMMQSLAFYDALLSHDHPGYLGVLRVAMIRSKGQTDLLIIRLYLVTLMLYIMTVVTGIFSMNVNIPRNGISDNPHTEPDGSESPFYLFGIVIVLVFLSAVGLCLVTEYVFRQAEKRTGRKIKFW